MENFNIDSGIYLPEQPRELISPVLQDYANSGAFITSEKDYAESISMPGDTMSDLINKVEAYTAMSQNLVNQPNPEMPGPGMGDFNMEQSMSKLYKGLNPSTPSLKASARPQYLGSAEELERYASSDNFQTFGFSPSLGSEQEYRYGRAMSWGETMGKAFAGSALLAKDTFVEGWKGWGRMAEALFTLDASKLYGSREERYQMAKEQEAIFNKYAIYSTEESEDSILNRQFFGNMVQQVGFTVGALAQMGVETYLGGRFAKIIASAAGGINKGRALAGAATVGELINDTRKVQQLMSNTQRITKALQELPRAMIPLFGTVQDLSKAAKAGAGTFQLAMIGAGGIKRELSMFNMARSEAIFEAASTYKDLEDKLTSEFRNTNGRDPNAEELESMRSTADRASSDNFYTNVGILTVMNRIQLDNMVKSFNRSRRIFNDNLTAFGDEVFEVTGKVGGKTVTKVYEKGFVGRLGAIGDIAKTFGKKTAAWQATKSIGKGLMKFEGSEGMQELLQEASNKGLSDYYYDLYNGKSGYDDKIDKVISSIKNPITDIEGTKTFLMGALTGRLIAPFSYGLSKINMGEEGKLRAAKKKESIDIINTFYADPTQYIKEQIANVKVQNRAARTMEEAAANQDRYTFHNAKDSAFAKAMASAIRLNMYESFRDTLVEFSDEMTPEEFRKAFGIDSNDANKRDVKQFLGNMVRQMDEYHVLYNNLRDKYADRIVPELYKYNAPEEYELVKIAKFAQDHAIEMLTTNVFKARQATKRAAQLQAEIAANTSIGASSIEILGKLGSEQAIDAHVKLLKQEVKSYESNEQLSPEQRLFMLIKKEELKLAEQWKDAYEDMQTYMGESYFPPNSVRKIYKAYENLINFYNQTENKNVSVSTQDIEDNFTKFIDYIQLNRDSKSFIDAMNVLADPYNSRLIVEALKDSISKAGSRMQEEHIAEVENIPTEELEITDEIYNNFIDKNIVPDNILNTIADKVINRTTLSEREIAIFSGKTAEINEIIRKKAPVSDEKADIVQTYEYKEKTQTVKKEISIKDGLTKVTFTGERSDKPGKSSKSGYIYGEPTSNSVQQFFDDYGITIEDIVDGLSLADIRAVKVIEERTANDKTVITFIITYSKEMGGMSSEPMVIAVKKQKFTSGAEIAALDGGKPASDDSAKSTESGDPDPAATALEAAFKAGYEKYLTNAEKTGVKAASYDQWKNFSVGAKEILRKFEAGEATEQPKEEEPKTYPETFDVSAVNTEAVTQDVVDEVLSSTTTEKSDNFENAVDDFFNNLTTCNISDTL